MGAKPFNTPMIPNVQITEEGDLFEDPDRYKRLVAYSRPIWEIELSYNNSFGYCLFSKCFESVYVISHNQSLGSCGAYPMLLERSP